MSELRPPPEHAHLRWHWIKQDVGEPFIMRWERLVEQSMWKDGFDTFDVADACSFGWRYHSPCDPDARANGRREGIEEAVACCQKIADAVYRDDADERDADHIGLGALRCRDAIRALRGSE